MPMIKNVIILLSTMCFFFEESSSLDPTTTPLIQRVLGTQGLNLIPIQSETDILDIKLVVSVQTIHEVDRERNRVEASLFVSEIWPTGISWNPQDFNGMSRQVVDKSQIWTPDVVIGNAASRPEMLSPPKVVLKNNGQAILNMHLKIDLDCDVTENACLAKFQSASFFNNVVTLNGLENVPVELGWFHESFANKGGRFGARDGKYEKSQMSLFDGDPRAIDVVTYSFSIKDTQPFYRHRPSSLLLSWN